MRLVDADALSMKLRHMGYMDENEEVQEVIDRLAKECGDDSISRQAAIDAVIKRDANCGIDSAEVLKALSSAEPERKTGKWISKLHSNWGKWGIYVAICSECGFSGGAGKWNFCPNCGAKMEVQDD